MSWKIDPAHTRIGFTAKHLMVSTVRGEFKAYRGVVHLDPKDFTQARIEGEVDVSSVETGNADRDTHLRNSDFFDAPNHPKMSFKSTAIEAKGDGEYTVRGELTLRGVTLPVSFDVEFNGVSKSPWGTRVAGLSARATLNRKDFGLNFNALLEGGGVVVSDKVKLELDAELIEAVEQPAPVVAAATASEVTPNP